VDDWGPFLNAVSLALALTGIGLACWSLSQGSRGEKSLRRIERAAERLDRMERHDRAFRILEPVSDIASAYYQWMTQGNVRGPLPMETRLKLRSNLLAALNRRGDLVTPAADALSARLEQLFYSESSEAVEAIWDAAAAAQVELFRLTRGEREADEPDGSDRHAEPPGIGAPGWPPS